MYFSFQLVNQVLSNKPGQNVQICLTPAFYFEALLVPEVFRFSKKKPLQPKVFSFPHNSVGSPLTVWCSFDQKIIHVLHLTMFHNVFMCSSDLTIRFLFNTYTIFLDNRNVNYITYLLYLVLL